MIDTDDIQRAVELRERVLEAFVQFDAKHYKEQYDSADAITAALIIAEALTNLNGGIAHG